MSFLLTSLPRGWRRHEVLIVVLSRQALPGASAGDVGAEGRVGDGDGVLVGEAFPDRRGGDLRVGLEHRVDVAVQSFEGGGLAVDLLPPGRAGGGERLDDGAAADVVLALGGPAGHAVAGVATDRGVLLPLGCVAAHTARPPRPDLPGRRRPARALGWAARSPLLAGAAERRLRTSGNRSWLPWPGRGPRPRCLRRAGRRLRLPAKGGRRRRRASGTRPRRRRTAKPWPRQPGRR